MKRLFSALTGLLLLMSLCACGASPVPSGSGMEPGSAAASASSSAPGSSSGSDSPAPTEPELPPPAPEDPMKTLTASLSLEEKVGQLFFVRCPAENAAEEVQRYHLGGYVLFGRDFQTTDGRWLTEAELTAAIESYQSAALADSGIPLLIGVDEEGGSVARASRNPHLFSSKAKSPQWLARNAREQTDPFSEDAREKSSRLLELGINVNLAPVADVSTNPTDFIYDRTLGQDAPATAAYVESVVTAMDEVGIGSVLKHFPGYGSNVDTHTGIAVDTRPLEQFESADFLPFSAGIAAGTDEQGLCTTAVLVSHNIMTSVDDTLPASLSPAVHGLVRNTLNFDGVVMTDDLAMDAVAAYAEDGAAAVMALQAGNDLIITSDYQTQIPLVLEAVRAGDLDEAVIDAACTRVLRWKSALKLL